MARIHRLHDLLLDLLVLAVHHQEHVRLVVAQPLGYEQLLASDVVLDAGELILALLLCTVEVRFPDLTVSADRVQNPT